MKYSKFKLTEVNNIGSSIAYRATVNVKKLFRKPKTINIASDGVMWYEIETGEFTENYTVETLFRAYQAQFGTETNKETI